MRSGWTATVIGLTYLFSLAGCGGTPPPATGNNSEVKKLGIAFMRFVGSHRGKAPANRDELDKFLAAMKSDELKAMGIENIREIYQSSRDDSELVVRYGITIPPPNPSNPTVVAYEKEGVGGKRLVVYETAGVEEISAERLKELVPDAK